MYIIFNKEENRILCKDGYIDYWSGDLSLVTEVTPFVYTSKLSSKAKARMCGGISVKFKVEPIPEEGYLIGSYVYCWILDTHTNKVEKIEGFLQVYLDRVRYKLVNWD